MSRLVHVQREEGSSEVWLAAGEHGAAEIRRVRCQPVVWTVLVHSPVPRGPGFIYGRYHVTPERGLVKRCTVLEGDCWAWAGAYLFQEPRGDEQVWHLLDGLYALILADSASVLSRNPVSWQGKDISDPRRQA